MTNVFSREEAAKILGICLSTIDRNRKSGKLPFHQIGDRKVFTESDLTAFLDKCIGQTTAESTGGENENPS